MHLVYTYTHIYIYIYTHIYIYIYTHQYMYIKGRLTIYVFTLCNRNTLGSVFNVQIENMPNC